MACGCRLNPGESAGGGGGGGKEGEGWEGDG